MKVVLSILLAVLILAGILYGISKYSGNQSQKIESPIPMENTTTKNSSTEIVPQTAINTNLKPCSKKYIIEKVKKFLITEFHNKLNSNLTIYSITDIISTPISDNKCNCEGTVNATEDEGSEYTATHPYVHYDITTTDDGKEIVTVEYGSTNSTDITAMLSVVE